MNDVRALVLTGFGINCEEELAAAYRLAGADAEIAHLNQVLGGSVLLDRFQVLNFPGGFSFGDDLGSGKVLANRVRLRRLPTGETFLEAIQAFVDRGGFVLGICNGFQALVKLGLLPASLGDRSQEATLARNVSGLFEDRWVECAVNPASRTPFLRGIERMRLPVRHGEGRLVLRDDAVRDRVRAQALDCLTYCDEHGTRTDRYPANPNGSELACAGLTDSSGGVLGLMPHPEAALSLYNDPCWPQRRRANPDVDEAGQGLRLFRNIVEHLQDAAKKAD